MFRRNKKLNTSNKEEKRAKEPSEEEGDSFWRQKSTFQLIFIGAAMVMIVMPFITTFNEFLTKIVERFHFYTILEDFVVPYLSRLIAVVLKPLGHTIMGTHEGLFIADKNLAIKIAWNCIGWQSIILIIITLVTGIQGHYSRFSKAQTILIGLLGTFLLNVFRIASVVVVAIYFGYFPAVIYHDYFSNLLIVFWLFLFWWFAYAYVLERIPGGQMIEEDTKRGRKKRRFSLFLPRKVSDLVKGTFHREKGSQKEIKRK